MGRIGAGIIVLGTKIGFKLLPIMIKLVKFVKIGKFGLVIGSIAAYTYLFTWQFAVMVMILLFVHESGHIWAMKRCRLKTKGIYFIPFLGAAAVSDDLFKSRRDEVYIAIMGPIWGFALAGIVTVLYFWTGDMLFGAVAGWMAMINLFNLLPINPLDGGRIMKSIIFSISSKLGLIFLMIGIAISIILTFWVRIILFSVLLMVGLLEFMLEYYMRDPDRIVKKCIKDIDGFINRVGMKDDYSMKNAANNIKNILADKKECSLMKIKKVASIQKDETADFNERMLSSLVSYRLDRFCPMPKMTIIGIVISVIAYVAVAGILWALMTYMNHIPEVEIARQLFMS